MPHDALPFRSLDHVVIRVPDLARALVFYRDVLGCEVERVLEDVGLWQLRAGDSLIDLVDTTKPLGLQGGQPPGPDTPPNMDHFCLTVDPFDAEAIRAHLQGHGVAVGEVARRYGAQGYGPSLYCQDPDGNTVELKGPPEA